MISGWGWGGRRATLWLLAGVAGIAIGRIAEVEVSTLANWGWYVRGYPLRWTVKHVLPGIGVGVLGATVGLLWERWSVRRAAGLLLSIGPCWLIADYASQACFSSFWRSTLQPRAVVFGLAYSSAGLLHGVLVAAGLSFVVLRGWRLRWIAAWGVGTSIGYMLGLPSWYLVYRVAGSTLEMAELIAESTWMGAVGALLGFGPVRGLAADPGRVQDGPDGGGQAPALRGQRHPGTR